MIPIRILVFGSTGMLGQALLAECRLRGHAAAGIARSAADYCLDMLEEGKVRDCIHAFLPDIVINTVGLTNLAECEKDPGLAYQVNARSAALLARICSERKIYLVHTSTDHYYTGDKDAKHQEDSPIRLLNEYARTKYAAECFVRLYDDTLVVRTNIVGFRGKPDQPTFVEWAIHALQNGQPMTLYEDYYTSSITVRQFAEALFELMDKRVCGLVNLAGGEVASKRVFVETLAAKLGYGLSNVSGGQVNSNSKLTRAESLGLDVSKAEAILGYTLPGVVEVVEDIIRHVRSENTCNMSL